MAYYIINGGVPLTGTVTISGSKNAAAAVLPATLLANEPCTLENIPDIEDIRILVQIMRNLGVKIQYNNANSLYIDPTNVNTGNAVSALMGKLRASSYLLGALLGRLGEAKIALPGGCSIGERPLNYHIMGMRALGAEVIEGTEDIGGKCVDTLSAKASRLVGSEIYLRFASVGATINIMLAAARATGTTIINNAAREPHIVDVANFLNLIGASVRGAGTNVIRIRGTGDTHGCSHTIIPDQIETGTYMIAAAATRGDVTINNIIPHHMESLTAKFMECGISVTEGSIHDRERFFRIRSDSSFRPRAVDISTQPYPGFPTDLQQPMSVMLCVSGGKCHISENVFETRLSHLNEMRFMGADTEISDDNQNAIIRGVPKIYGAEIFANDLRASAALVIGALMADGDSIVHNAYYLERGYENMETKLRELGADIRRVEDNIEIMERSKL